MTSGIAEACEAAALKCQTGLPGIREDQCVDDIDEAAMEWCRDACKPRENMSERQIFLHPGVRDICRQVTDAVVEIGLCGRLADRVALAAA